MIKVFCLAVERFMFETQEEVNAWKAAFEAGISYALGDDMARNVVFLFQIVLMMYLCCLGCLFYCNFLFQIANIFL